ncbi:MAG: hypothetical protein LQ351_005968 [Letrouitia transgressa]|nr:MAG: hypothetical protein LQ351_005968 [Letrouitia transgressa]
MERTSIEKYRHGLFDFEIEKIHSSAASSFYSQDSFPSTENVLAPGSTIPNAEPPPNGGLVAWTQVVMGHLLVFNGFGYVSSFGLFQSYYANTLGRPASDISWVGSFQMFLLFFVGTLSGRAMDAGYFRSLVVAGCSLQLLGVFTTSFCQQYWQLFLAQGVVQGLGNGLLFTPTVALISTYFTTKRALALGFAACGAPTGGIVFPTIARQLTSQIGFPWTVRVMGFVILFNTILVIVFIKPRLGARPKGPLVEWAAFKELPYALFAIGIFLALLGLYFAYYYIAIFGKTIIHVPSSTSLTLLMLINGIGIPGRLIPALLADRFFGPFNTLLPCVFFSGIMLLFWIGVRDVTGLFIFTAIYGFWANAVQTLFPSTLSSLTTDLTKMGVRVGMVFTIVSIACLTGPPIAGALMQADGGKFLYAQLFGGTTMLSGTAVLTVARVVQVRQGKAASR